MKDGDWLSGGVVLRKCEETEFKITDLVDEERVQDALCGTICDDGLAALSFPHLYLLGVSHVVFGLGLRRGIVEVVPGVLSPPRASIPYPPMLQMTVLIYLVPALPLRHAHSDRRVYVSNEMHLT